MAGCGAGQTSPVSRRWRWLISGWESPRPSPWDTDYDYYYEVGSYIVHLQVKDGAVAFLDSQCPDHVCEDFGWLSQPGQWACCVPAGVYLSVEETE